MERAQTDSFDEASGGATGPVSQEASGNLAAITDELRQDLLASEIAFEIDIQERFGRASARDDSLRAELGKQSSRLHAELDMMRRYMRRLAMRMRYQERAQERGAKAFAKLDSQELSKVAVEAFLDGEHHSGACVHLAKIKPDAKAIGVDCEVRKPKCHAACCWLGVPMTETEARSGELRLDIDQPFYLLREPRGNCAYLCDNKCTIYDSRPHVCRTYRCRDDRRIWQDHEKMVPGPMVLRIESMVQKQREKDAADGNETSVNSCKPGKGDTV